MPYNKSKSKRKEVSEYLTGIYSLHKLSCFKHNEDKVKTGCLSFQKHLSWFTKLWIENFDIEQDNPLSHLTHQYYNITFSRGTGTAGIIVKSKSLQEIKVFW